MVQQEGEIKKVRVTDLWVITRMAYENMIGVDRQFSNFVRPRLVRLAGYLFFPLYFLLSGQGYKFVLNGQIAGCAFLYLNRRSGYAFNVNVNQPYRRQGIGGQLMNYLEMIAREKGAEWLALHVDVGNTPARTLYRRLGYREYHPHFLRREDGVNLSQAAGVRIEPLSRYKGRQLYDHYLVKEQHTGDRWAAHVLQENSSSGSLEGDFWRCWLNQQEVGCALVGGTVHYPVVTLVLDQAYWGHFITAGLIQALVDRGVGEPARIDLHFGSSTHYEKAFVLLEGLGFQPQTQSRILMLKPLTHAGSDTIPRNG